MRLRHPRWAAGMALASALALSACGSSSKPSTTSSAPSSSPTTSAASTSSQPAASTAATESVVKYMKAMEPPHFTAPSSPVKVALLLSATQTAGEQSIKLGVEQAAKKDNAQVTVFDAGGSVTTQVNQMETAIGQHPRAIIVLPASPVALNAGIAQATSQGIAVLGELIPPSSKDVKFSFVDPLPNDAAEAVDALAAKIAGKGDIFAIYGGAGSAINTLFAQGVNAELKQKYPNIKVVFTKDLPDFSASGAESATENALVKNPNVAGIITNDDGLGEGAALAFKTAGKRPVPIAGEGPSNAQDIAGIRSGAITIGVSPPLYESGYQILQWALAIHAGVKPAHPLLPIPALVITSSNIQQAISSGLLFQSLAPATIGCGPGQAKQC